MDDVTSKIIAFCEGVVLAIVVVALCQPTALPWMRGSAGGTRQHRQRASLGK